MEGGVEALSRHAVHLVDGCPALACSYAFMLSWAGTAPLTRNDVAPSLFTAVQEQLGLRLEASTEPVDALIIERVEPTPN